MDWDLWGPPNDIEESGFDNSQCDFYFGYGFDVIEEEALNEKSCVQVLRILIKKADTEILEFEQDLLSLQTELAWVENEDWPDICCNALREKIDFLDISIKNLTSKDKNEIEVRLLMYTQPVETLDEILKVLFRNYVCKKDKQHKNAIVLGSSSDAPQHATNGLDKEKRLSNCNLETVTSEKTKDCSSIPTDHCAILNLQGKKTGNSMVVKLASSNIKVSAPQSSEVAPDSSDKKKSLSLCIQRSTGKGDAREHGSTPEDEKLIQSLSSKSASKGRHSLKPVNDEPTENSASNSTIYALENAVTPSYKEKLGDSDSIATDEVEEQSSLSTADVVTSVASSKPVVKKTDLRKIVKPSNIAAKDFGPSGNRNAAHRSSEMKMLVTPDLKVIGNEEATGLQSRARGKSKTSSSSLNLDGRRNRPGTDEPAGAILKIVRAEALRSPAGLHGTKHNSDCALGTFKQAKGSSSGIEQNLSEFAPKSALKRTVKELKIAVAHDVVSLKSSRKTNGKKKTPLIVKFRETDLTDNENCALTSLLEIQDHGGRNTAKLQPDEEKPMLVEVRMTEISADEKRSNLNLSLIPQKEKGKRHIKSNPPILHEIGFSELILKSSSSISESNKKRKSGAGPQNASLNQTLSRKITKKAARPDKGEAREHGAATSKLQKTKKVCVNFPFPSGTEDSTVQMDLSSSLGDTIDGASKDDFSVDESCSICDSSSEVVASFSSAISTLRDLPLAELRTIAGQLKLTKFSKLRKAVLLEQITERLVN
ncbi:serine-rich adhesin for platelets-like isoform X1 [Populus alba x Populus x berolinensis]|nr:serine-rich adhesin for platelets-like isoform X1 [Populus alba x Populus x berolinensis]